MSPFFLFFCLLLGTALAWDNETTPLSSYRSRPDLLSPALQVTLFEEGAVEPGLVFIGAYQTEQPGPYIYDKRGNLVWSGFAHAGPGNVHNPYVCHYNGTPHLCMFQGHQFHGYARGHGIILNNEYELVAHVQAGGDAAAVDQHEFRVIDGGKSALIAIYQQQEFDLSRAGVLESQGWIQDSLFQEVSLEDGSLIFEWSALQHIDPLKSHVFPKASDIVGDGLSALTPWDFFHINSIGKSQLTGNYIVSARHMGSIYYVDGRNGSVIWTLQAGGDSDFACLGFNFSFQHDAQIRAENETSMTISLFDNSSNGFNRTTNSSTTKIVTLDYQAKTATLDNEIHYPHHVVHVPSQGNTQYLDGGNIFIGYGGWPCLSEHRPDGSPVWTAEFGTTEGIIMSYRSSSAEWHAIPRKTRPTLRSFSRDRDAPVAMYVSWNGCTEIGSWNFYGSNDIDEEMTKIGSTGKGGFETSYMSETHFTFTVAEAVGFDGSPLRKSPLVQTFVPSAQLGAFCVDTGCPGS